MNAPDDLCSILTDFSLHRSACVRTGSEVQPVTAVTNCRQRGANVFPLSA